MDIYEKTPIYDRYTREPDGFHRVKVGYYCDYCGVKHLNDDDEFVEYVSFTINEVSECEESYYYYESEILKKHDVDIHLLFSNHNNYRYCCDMHGNNCTSLMIANVSADTSLDSVMQLARIAVVEKLLENGVDPNVIDIVDD